MTPAGIFLRIRCLFPSRAYVYKQEEMKLTLGISLYHNYNIVLNTRLGKITKLWSQNSHSTHSTTSLSEQLDLIKQYCLQTACCVSYVYTNAYLVTRKRVHFMFAGYRNYKL